jgi:hypothetical protein
MPPCTRTVSVLVRRIDHFSYQVEERILTESPRAASIVAREAVLVIEDTAGSEIHMKKDY